MYREDFNLESLPEATTYLRDLGLAVSRLNKVAHESLQFFIFWLAAVLALVTQSFSSPRGRPVPDPTLKILDTRRSPSFQPFDPAQDKLQLDPEGRSGFRVAACGLARNDEGREPAP
jgi:hypothetical protein